MIPTEQAPEAAVPLAARPRGLPADRLPNRGPYRADIKYVELAKGLNLNLVRTLEAGERLLVCVRIGNGILGCAPGKLSPKWAIDAGSVLYGGAGGKNFDEIQSELDQAGVLLSNALGDDRVIFTAVGPCQTLEFQLGLIARFIGQPDLSSEAVGSAKRLYVNEILPKFSTKSLSILNRTLPYIFNFGDGRWSPPSADDAEVANEEDLVAEIKGCLRTKSIDITIVGNFDFEKAITLSEKAFLLLRSGLFPESKVSLPAVVNVGPVVEKCRKDFDRLGMHFACWAATDVKSDPQSLLTGRLLGQLVQSQLSEGLAEKLGRSSIVSGSMEIPCDSRRHAFLWLGFLGAPEISDVFRDVTARVRDRFLANKISDEQIEAAKERLQASLREPSLEFLLDRHMEGRSKFFSAGSALDGSAMNSADSVEINQLWKKMFISDLRG